MCRNSIFSSRSQSRRNRGDVGSSSHLCFHAETHSFLPVIKHRLSIPLTVNLIQCESEEMTAKPGLLQTVTVFTKCFHIGLQEMNLNRCTSSCPVNREHSQNVLSRFSQSSETNTTSIQSDLVINRVPKLRRHSKPKRGSELAF